MLNVLMKMAKSNYWQNLYAHCKDLGNIRLFKNDTDLSKTQIMLLNLLQTYKVLYEDLSSGEEYISEEVIDDELRTEAYLLLRKQRIQDKNKPENQTNTKKVINQSIPGVRFTGK